MNYLAVVVLIGLSSLAQAQYYTSSCPNGYQIQSGDTFYKLASSNLGGMCAWLNANTYPNVATTVDPCNLKVGQCVNIPTSTTSTYCPNNYSAYSCFSNYGTPTGNYYGTGYSTKINYHSKIQLYFNRLYLNKCRYWLLYGSLLWHCHIVSSWYISNQVRRHSMGYQWWQLGWRVRLAKCKFVAIHK